MNGVFVSCGAKAEYKSLIYGPCIKPILSSNANVSFVVNVKLKICLSVYIFQYNKNNNKSVCVFYSSSAGSNLLVEYIIGVK